MHDGIEVERRGVPAAAIVTDAFVPTAVAMTKIDGAPDYPYLIAPHPLSNLTEPELRARAELLAPAVAGVLLRGQAAKVTA